jgi:hypothetical protein
MKQKVFAAFFAMTASVFLANTVLAEVPKAKPGKWSFKTTVTIPMMPEPRVISDTKCITEEEANRDHLTEMLKESKCTILKREESDDTVEFEVECEGDMGVKTKGKGHFTTDGTTMTGEIEIIMNMAEGNQSMTMTQKWEAKWIGDCE